MLYTIVSPIIEVRQDNVHVSDFYGLLDDTKITLRYNLVRNKTKYIIDSSGKVWVLHYIGNNKTGFRTLLSPLWNVSNDFYSYEVMEDRDVGWIRNILSPYLKVDNPDCVDLVDTLLRSISSCNGDVKLAKVIGLMNL